MKRTRVGIVAMTMLIVVCGLLPATGAAQSGPPAMEETLTVTLGWTAPPPEKPNQALQQYLEERFNFRFNLVAFDSSAFDQQLAVMIAGGEIPDIIRHNFQTMVQYYELGVVRELPMTLI